MLSHFVWIGGPLGFNQSTHLGYVCIQHLQPIPSRSSTICSYFICRFVASQPISINFHVQINANGMAGASSRQRQTRLIQLRRLHANAIGPITVNPLKRTGNDYYVLWVGIICLGGVMNAGTRPPSNRSDRVSRGTASRHNRWARHHFRTPKHVSKYRKSSTAIGVVSGCVCVCVFVWAELKPQNKHPSGHPISSPFVSLTFLVLLANYLIIVYSIKCKWAAAKRDWGEAIPRWHC